MATKRARAERVIEDKKRRYDLSVKKLKNYPLFAIAFAIVSVMLLLLKFSHIYNSNAKVDEISYTGFQLFFAAISGGFTSPNKIYGDISVYNYHTPTETQLSGIFVLISVILMLTVIGMSVWDYKSKKPMLNIVSAILFTVIFILLTACFIIIKTSPIMIKYQCNLKVCSLHSLAIIPAIFALIGAAVSWFATFQYFIARKILKD